MRYFYDCEFLENGHTIELISIGIVAEDGREYYAVVSEIGDDTLYKRILQNDWLMTNVVPHLPLKKCSSGKPVYTKAGGSGPGSFLIDHDDPCVLPRWVIAKQVKAFLLGSTTPELWAYYGAYDHVALCQLWGRMVRLPKGIPMFTHDLMQEASRIGSSSYNPFDDPNMPKQEGLEHNALDDARWNRNVFNFLETLRPGYHPSALIFD